MNNSKRAYNLREILHMPDDTIVRRGDRLSSHLVSSMVRHLGVSFTLDDVITDWHIVDPPPKPLTFETSITTASSYLMIADTQLERFIGRKVRVTVEAIDDSDEGA